MEISKKLLVSSITMFGLAVLVLLPGCKQLGCDKVGSKVSTTTNNTPGATAYCQSYDDCVKEFMSVTGMKDNMNKMIDMSLQHFDKSGDENVKAMLNKFKTKMSSDEILDQLAAIYKKYFSEAELKELINFHKSIIGKKSLQVMPEIALEVQKLSMQTMQQLAQENMPPQIPTDTASKNASGPASKTTLKTPIKDLAGA